MSDLIAKFTSLPAYGIAAVFVLLLYAVQSEVRFGKRARSIRTEASDRNSTRFGHCSRFRDYERSRPDA